MRGDGTGEVIWESLAVARNALIKWFVNWYRERGCKMGPGSVGIQLSISVPNAGSTLPKGQAIVQMTLSAVESCLYRVPLVIFIRSLSLLLLSLCFVRAI